MLVIFGGIIFHMRMARDKMKRPLHLYDTWGLRNVHVFESGLVGLEGGDLNNVI